MTPEIKQRIQQIRQGKTPKGYKKTKEGILPDIWGYKKFQDCASISSGLIDPQKHPYCDMFHIGPENIEKDSGKIIDLKKACEIGLKSGKYLFDSDSIVYSKIRPNLNKVCVPEFDGICSADCYSIKANYGVNKLYLFNIMLSDEFVKKTISCSMRTGMPKINQDELNTIMLPLPPLPEQTAIAEILSTQDRVIELKEQLLAEKKQQKKYLMQQLLTGKKRLKGFKGEWKRCKLGEVCKFQNGFAFKSDSFKESGIPLLRISNIQNESICLSDIVYIDLKDYCEDLSNYVVYKNDIVIAMSGATTGKIGINKCNIEFLLNQRVGKFVCMDCMNNEYLYFVLLFNTNIFYSQSAGGAQPNLNTDDIKMLGLFLPPLPEQAAIAEILSTADREIELLGQSIEAEKRKKKSLMQLLLTGIVRVGGVL